MKVLWKSWAKKCRTAVLLSPAEKVLLLRACCWLPRLRTALARRPFQAVLGEVQRHSGHIRPPRPAGPGPRDICRLVENCAANLPGSYTCLPIALAGYILCVKYGYPVKLLFGAAPSNGPELKAHAWLEFNGEVILGGLSDLEKFRVFHSPNKLSP